MNSRLDQTFLNKKSWIPPVFSLQCSAAFPFHFSLIRAPLLGYLVKEVRHSGSERTVFELSSRRSRAYSARNGCNNAIHDLCVNTIRKLGVKGN